MTEEILSSNFVVSVLLIEGQDVKLFSSKASELFFHE